jgi:hypothetical protein
MGAIAVLAGIGILALLASQGGASGSVGSPTNIQDELKKLYAESQSAGDAVQKLLVAQGNPALMVQYAAQLAAKYPGLSKALVDRFKATVVPITGKSGTMWNTWSTGPKPGTNVTPVDVLLDAQPILSYEQTGADMTTRKLVGSAQGVDSATLARAKSDFMLA